MIGMEKKEKWYWPYVEIQKLTALHLNGLIGDWLDDPNNDTLPIRERMEEALSITHQICTNVDAQSIRQHKCRINQFIGCMKTIKEATDGHAAYVEGLPYHECFLGKYNNLEGHTIKFITDRQGSEPDILTPNQHKKLMIISDEGQSLRTYNAPSSGWTHDTLVKLSDFFPPQWNVCGAEAWLGEQWIGSTEI
ncbi:hypothetical protein AB4455_12045 [Vibrio sp. 10N.261.46.E12]|nr:MULTISPECIES: hypothetical protein [unclassified Vibrio]